MDTISPPPSKRLCFGKEILTSESSKVVRSFNLPQQFPSRNQVSSSNNVPKLLKFKSVDGKDLGEFKVKMISKNGLQVGKTIMVMKPMAKTSAVETSTSPSKVQSEENMLKLQTQYTTKAQFLPEVELKITEKSKLASHRPLILKKSLKPVGKIESNSKIQMIKITKPILNDVKTISPVTSIPEKITLGQLPDQGKVIKSYTRTLKKIGPNMQLLPHDSPDAKTIINTVEPINKRNGTIRILQKPLLNISGIPIKVQQNGTNDLNQNLSIIEQALSSLSDEQLREKALRALAECKTSNERKVPVKIPQEMKSMCDSLVQTDVFSIMVPGEFVVTSNNCEKIKRQVVKEHEETKVNTTEDMKENSEKKTYQKDLDEMLENFGNKNENVQKILDKKKIRLPEKILRNLYNDYRSLKEFNEDGVLGIHHAVMMKDLKTVKRMLLVMKCMKGMNIDVETAEGNTSLELAVECDVGMEIIKALVDAGAKPGSDVISRNSAILIASKKSLPCLSYLIDHIEKSHLDNTDMNGYSCLHYCAQNGNLECARKLLIRGADVNLQDKKSGKTALFMTLENQYEELTKLLISYDANPSIPNFGGQTILPLIEGINSYALRAMLHKSIR